MAEYKKPIKAFQGKRKKLAVLSKPHILPSQMVLLSEHLILNLDWMKFLPGPIFKEEVAHLGMQTSAAYFLCDLWLLWAVAHGIFFSSRFACLLPADNTSTVFDLF